MTIIIRRSWTQQPQYPARLNQSNPITRGLFFAWNAPGRIDAASGRAATGVGVSLAPSVKGMYGVGNGVGYAAFPNAASASNQLSVFTLWYPTVSDYQELFVFGLGKGFVSRQQFVMYQAGANVYGDINGGSPGNRPFTAGKINSAAFVIDSGVSSGTTFYVNNSAASPTTYTLSTLTGVQDIEVLRNVYAWGISPSGGVLLTLAWNRLLSVAELGQLHYNPWQLFAPRRLIIPTATAAATAPTLSALSAINVTATSAQPRMTYTF